MASVEARLEALEARARATTRVVDVLADAFPEQRACAVDESPLKVVFCTRRAAKSYTFGLECLEDSKRWPTANYLFLGLVREEAKRIFWKDVLKALDEKHKLGIVFNESSLTATLPSGATLYVGAADANEKEFRKLLGQKYRKVAIDEAQDWTHTNLEELVFHALKPACADFHGSISLMGTPGKLAKGLFRELTPVSVQAGMRGARGLGAQGWSLHCWDTSANTAVMADGKPMAEHWAAEIAQLRAMKPGIDETPWFRRNYRGEWVTEDTALVYRYAAGRNDYVHLPEHRAGQWHYVLGCDLGYTDATAWVVCAYHDFERVLYVLTVLKEAGLDITAVARRTDALRRAYDFDVLVIDGANKQAVEEMVNRHKIPWQAADKTGKSDFVELMNAEFVTGAIKLSTEAKPLADEYAALIWDEKKLKSTGVHEEHPACENHACDAALYAWRHCYQYLSEQPTPPPKDEDVLEQQAEARLVAQQRGEESSPLSPEEVWQWQ